MRIQTLPLLGLILFIAFSGHSHSVAEDVARKEQLRRLVLEIVPDVGVARPPFDLARHDLGFAQRLRDWDRAHPWPKITQENVEARQQNGNKKLAALRKWARTRQLHLTRTWKKVKRNRSTLDKEPIFKAPLDLLGYAFGEVSLKKALHSARNGVESDRLRLAKLLLAECRFDTAVDLLIKLAEAPNESLAFQTIALLVRLQKDRNHLAKYVALVPMKVNLANVLNRISKNESMAGLIKTLGQSTNDHISPNTEPLSHDTREENFQAVLKSFPVESDIPRNVGTYFWELDDEIDVWRTRSIMPGTLNEAYLETDSTQLLLTRASFNNELVTGTSAFTTLHSSYCGPMTFRLYAFPDRESWQRIHATALNKQRPLRTWIKTYYPLSKNNHKSWNEEIEIPDLPEGYFLLTVGARYAPLTAGQKFAVSRVALYVRTAHNKAVIMAVDRTSGEPVSDVPVTLRIDGKPMLSWLKTSYEGFNQSEFLAGFQNDPFTNSLNPQRSNMESHLRAAKAYQDGQKIRKRFPNLSMVLKGKTDATGAQVFEVDIGRDGYEYTLFAQRQGSGIADARVVYKENRTANVTSKALVWFAQPVYRPEATVHFKGIIRRFDGTKVADYRPAKDPQKRTVNVHIESEKNRTLWRGVCNLSSVGSFQASFDLPPTADLGSYRVLVDGIRCSPYSPLRIEEFRLPTFKLTLKMNQALYKGGGQARGMLSVAYATGKPGQRVTAEVVLENGTANRDPVHVITDSKGQATFTLDVPQVESQTRFMVHAFAVDASGESYSASGDLDVTAVPFQVTLTVSPDPAYIHDPLVVDVKALNWDGQPLVGATVALEGLHKTLKTNALGSAHFSLTAGYDRQQIIRCTVIHAHEVVHAQVHVNLMDRARQNSIQANGVHRDFFKIHIESNINSGDDVQVNIELDRQNGEASWIALFVENSRMLAHRTLKLEPGKHIVHFPTTRDYTPSVRIQGIQFLGDRIKSDTTNCYVAPIHHFLTLELTTDREEYRPAADCQVQIRALDYKGRPVPHAEISLGVVNRQVYWLREDPTPDLQDFFFRYRVPVFARGKFDGTHPVSRSVFFWKGPKYTWGYLNGDPYSIDSLGLGGGGQNAFGRYGGGGRRMRAKTFVRKDFKNTAYWVANLITNAEGQAAAQFKWPDNITYWRFTARGLTADTKVGKVIIKRRTILPLQISLSLPRALRLGDKMQARAVVHNNKGPRRSVSVSYQNITGQGEVPLEIDSGAVQAVPFPVEPIHLSPIIFKAHVQDTREALSDAIERTWPVLPRGHKVQRTFAGAVGQSAQIPLTFSAPIISGSLKVTIRAEAGVSGPIQSAIEHMIGYPYGCVEQTMSRFMPAIVASQALKDARIKHPMALKLPEIFKKGIERLHGFQHSDGGWGWWAKDDTNDVMTAYVLEGLGFCREANWDVPESMLENGERYLFKRLINDTLDEGKLHSVGEVRIEVYAAYALARIYASDSKKYQSQIKRIKTLLIEFEDKAELFSARDYALVSSTYRLLGNKLLAQDWLASTRQMLAKQANPRSYVLGLATILEAEVHSNPKDVRWVELVSPLLKRRKGPAWIDTYVSSTAIRALVAVLKPSKGAAKSPSPSPFQILADNKVIASITPNRNGFSTMVLSKKLVGIKQLSLRAKDARSTDLYWSAEVEAYLSEAPEMPQVADAKLDVSVYTIGQNPKKIEMENGVLKVRQSQTLQIRVTCALERAMNALRISIPRPCGVEIVQAAKLNHGLVAYEERDDAFHFFVDGWEKGTHYLEFLVRAEAPGEAFAPMPQFAPMYGALPKLHVSWPTVWKITKK